jgi:hypothetical protein
MLPTAENELKRSLEAHNDAFEALLGLIPPQYYLVQDLTEEQVKSRPSRPSQTESSMTVLQASSKYQKHKNQKGPKQAIKEASKKAKRDKVRALAFPSLHLSLNTTYGIVVL